jgi:hypothetical protein
MNKLFFLMNFLLLASFIYSDDNYIIDRSPFVVKLSVDEENYYQWMVPQGPYVHEGNYIQLYPGETLFIEADVLENGTIKLAVVKEIFDSAKTIIVNFNQHTKKENERIHDFMMLTIKNPFDRHLDYKADIYLMGHNGWTNTSIIGVGANLTTYEMWPNIIGSIVLHDFMLK